MKYILVGIFALLFSSCAGHVEPTKELPAQEESIKTAFCQMAEQQMAHNEKMIKENAAEDGLTLEIKVTECDLINDAAGRIYYTLRTHIGDQPVLTIDAIAIIMRMDGGWGIVKDTPIYIMDHMRGEFSWFVQERVADDEERGQEL